MIGDDEWIRSALERLVAISSPSGGERRALEEVERLMIEAGGRVRRVPVDRHRLRDEYGFESPTVAADMYAVVGSWGDDGARPFVVLNGHIDTVEPAGVWRIPPLEPRILDGWLNGLGSADMKAGLVAAIAGAARAAATGDLAGLVEVQAVPDEEAGGGTGTLACVDELARCGRRPDLAVVCEPTSLAVATAQVGSRALALRVTGVEAHANTKHLGLNAVELALDLAGELMSWADRPDRTLHPLLPPASVNIGRIDGGTGATTVAAECLLEVCFTYHPADAPTLVADVDEIVGKWRARQDPRATVALRELHDVRPFQTDPSLPAVAALNASAGQDLTAHIGFHAGSDGRLLDGVLGTPTLICGPGDIRRVHRADEAVELREVSAHAAALERFLLNPDITVREDPTT